MTPLPRSSRPGVRVVGLTGGVASGKSTVARLLVELGARVVDADALAREVVGRGRPAYREIVREFGREVLAADGSLDRKALGARIFADPAARQRLNAITHPRIRRAAHRAIRGHLKEGAPLIIYEAALLVENQLQRELDSLIVVSVPEEVQVQRLMQRDGIDRAAALLRVRSQLPLADKLAVADFVIDTSGTIADTRRQVEELWHKLT